MPQGKGLEALIGKKGKARKLPRKTENARKEKGVFHLEVSKIVANPHQPRKDFSRPALAELAASIRSHGILQPLVVEKEEVETTRGLEVRYKLLAGERRLRAAKLVGLKTVPVVIRRAEDDRARLLVSLIENVQREDLNAMERAEAYARLRDDFGLSQDEIAERVGKARETVANTLRLLNLDRPIRDAIRRGELSEGHARALLSLEGPKRLKLFAELREHPMSVRQAEARAQALGRTPRVPIRRPDERRAEDEERLYEIFGVPVRITTRGERGSIAFLFSSKDEFKLLFRKLLGRR
jgi:ParB family chromosome partitioning protein